MGGVRHFTKIVLSIFLIVDLIALVLVFSFLSSVDFDLENKFSQIVEKGTNDFSNDSGFMDESKNLLDGECAGSDEEILEIDLGVYGSIEINCSDTSGEVGRVLEEETKKIVEESSGIDFNKVNSNLWSSLFLLSALGVILILGIAFIDEGGSLIYLGVDFMVAGSFFFVSFIVRSGAKEGLANLLPSGLGLNDLPVVDGFVSGLAWIILRNYLVVFVIGLVLVGFGIGLKFGRGAK